MGQMVYPARPGGVLVEARMVRMMVRILCRSFGVMCRMTVRNIVGNTHPIGNLTWARFMPPRNRADATPSDAPPGMDGFTWAMLRNDGTGAGLVGPVHTRLGTLDTSDPVRTDDAGKGSVPSGAPVGDPVSATPACAGETMRRPTGKARFSFRRMPG